MSTSLGDLELPYQPVLKSDRDTNLPETVWLLRIRETFVESVTGRNNILIEIVVH